MLSVCGSSVIALMIAPLSTECRWTSRKKEARWLMGPLRLPPYSFSMKGPFCCG